MLSFAPRSCWYVDLGYFVLSRKPLCNSFVSIISTVRFFFQFCFVAAVLYASNAQCDPVYGAIVIDARTNQELHSCNPDQQTQPASLTKMMTLLITFKSIVAKKISIHSQVSFSANAVSQKPTILGVKKGSTISVKTAILALITKSANDVAVALAEHIANGSEQNFVKLMNAEAKKLGMTSTVFCNPSGWKDTKQLTTVRDMAKLARALLTQYRQFYRLFATRSLCFQGKVMKNHNKLLGTRNGFVVDGIKTGFVNASGYNLAASAVRGNRRIIAVVVGGSSQAWRDKRVSDLLTIAFNQKKNNKTLVNISKNTSNKRLRDYNYERCRQSIQQILCSFAKNRNKCGNRNKRFGETRGKYKNI